MSDNVTKFEPNPGRRIWKRIAALVFLIVLVGGVVLNISPAWFVVVAAAAGVILKNWEARSK